MQRNRSRVRCYFLRHGAAVQADEWPGTDFERPLTKEGGKAMAREAKTLRMLRLKLDVIVTSPLLRAKQTAVIVAEKVKLREHVIEDDRVGLTFDAIRFADILNDFPNANAIMLVGHEPSMTETIGDLVGGARIDFKKGGLACVDIPDRSPPKGQLVWLIPPKLLLG